MLTFFDNKISDIELSSLKDIIGVRLDQNELTSLDITELTKLEGLIVNDNKLTELNLQNYKNYLLTNFDARNNPDLKCITVDYPPLAEEIFTNVDEGVEFSYDCSSSIVENDNDFKIYPNPADNTVTVERQEVETADVRILNIAGKICMSHTFEYGQTTLTLDISKLSTGTYIIEIGNISDLLIIK